MATSRYVESQGLSLDSPVAVKFWEWHYEQALFDSAIASTVSRQLGLVGHALMEAMALSRKLYGIGRRRGDRRAKMVTAAVETHRRGVDKDAVMAVLNRSLGWYGLARCESEALVSLETGRG